MLFDVMEWALQSAVHCDYFRLYNVICIVLSCCGTYSPRYVVYFRLYNLRCLVESIYGVYSVRYIVIKSVFYNVRCLVVSSFGPYSLRYIVITSVVWCNMLSSVMLLPSYPPTHCDYFRLSAFILELFKLHIVTLIVSILHLLCYIYLYYFVNLTPR